MLPASVRIVKTPRPLPPPDEEEDCAADLALAATATECRPVNPHRDVADYMISARLAHFLVYGRIS